MTRSQYQIFIHWRPLPYLVAMLFTLLILGLHMLPNMDSMLNENNTRVSHGFLKSQIDYHQEIAPFARRPLTSFLIEGTMEHLKFRAGHAFIFINFLLLFISKTLLFSLSKTLKATTAQGLVNMCVYFLSFSVLFAFFPPVFSYDEPLQYCFIFLSLIAFVRKKWLAFVPFFTLALIARETSVLLLPALAIFAPGLPLNFRSFTWGYLRFYLPLALPLLFYTGYLTVYMYSQNQFEATQVELASRYSCFLENFESIRNTVESFISLFLALGPFFYLVVFGKWRNRDAGYSPNSAVDSNGDTYKGSNHEPVTGLKSDLKTTPENTPEIGLKSTSNPFRQKQWVGAFLLTAILNTPLVILTAFTRETRLFALPLFFIWPVFACLFKADLRMLARTRNYLRMWRRSMYSVLFLFAMALNCWFCFWVYPGFGLGENTFFGEYLFLSNLFILLHLSLRKSDRQRALNF